MQTAQATAIDFQVGCLVFLSESILPVCVLEGKKKRSLRKGVRSYQSDSSMVCNTLESWATFL